MGTATVKWIGGKQFVGIDSTKHSVVLSTPDEGVGIKPSELLLIAVASCTAVDVVEILEKKRMGWRSHTLKSALLAIKIKIPPGLFGKCISTTA